MFIEFILFICFCSLAYHHSGNYSIYIYIRYNFNLTSIKKYIITRMKVNIARKYTINNTHVYHNNIFDPMHKQYKPNFNLKHTLGFLLLSSLFILGSSVSTGTPYFFFLFLFFFFFFCLLVFFPLHILCGRFLGEGSLPVFFYHINDRIIFYAF